MFIPLILGTARQGRQSEKVAKYLLAEIKAAGVETELLDVRDYPRTATDNSGTDITFNKLAPTMLQADGYIVVSPEYNHGYPGELKMFIDQFKAQFFKKPLGIAGVSSGPLGGARMTEKLRLVAIELRMTNIREALYFPFIQDAFEANGKPKDTAYAERIKVFLADLLWHADALKKARG